MSGSSRRRLSASTNAITTTPATFTANIARRPSRSDRRAQATVALEEAREHRDGVELHDLLITPAGEDDQPAGRAGERGDAPGWRVEAVDVGEAAWQQTLLAM